MPPKNMPAFWTYVLSFFVRQEPPRGPPRPPQEDRAKAAQDQEGRPYAPVRWVPCTNETGTDVASGSIPSDKLQQKSAVMSRIYSSEQNLAITSRIYLSERIRPESWSPAVSSIELALTKPVPGRTISGQYGWDGWASHPVRCLNIKLCEVSPLTFKNMAKLDAQTHHQPWWLVEYCWLLKLDSKVGHAFVVKTGAPLYCPTVTSCWFYWQADFHQPYHLYCSPIERTHKQWVRTEV